MINPTQGNKKIYLQGAHVNNTQSVKNSGPIFQDSLRLGAASTDTLSSFFSKIWSGVTTFFKSIANGFTRLFKSKPTSDSTTTRTTGNQTPSSATPATQTSSLKNKIQEIAARDGFVWFYKKEENPTTAAFGNFYNSPIQLWGMTFKCAEGAFQAAKFKGNRAVMQRFQNLEGDAAWKLGRQLSQHWTPEQKSQWQSINRDVMREVVKAKFSQNPELKELLLATRKSFLVEHIPVKGRDAFWGDDHDGTGQNWLGYVLMETRGQLGGAGPVGRNQQYNRFIRQG